MDSIGAEVGQKMRSAIKAKLMELNCYVDDELPDYIMVMVANKRSKSQMNEDLNLFLTNKTTTFVDWLHIVLKKLKEVTVTNPEIYKKAVKRKVPELTETIITKKEKKEIKKKEKSLTDDLPINANILAEQRKITLSNTKTDSDDFDIPLLSEVNLCSEQELVDIEEKIKSVKHRLGLTVPSDDEDCLNIKTEKEDLFLPNLINSEPVSKPSEPENAKAERKKIVFTSDKQKSKKSVLERLGKRASKESDSTSNSPTKRKRVVDRLSFGSKREVSEPVIRSQIGVVSKVQVPEKPQEEPEEPKEREVRSMIKIKPRVIPSDIPQANKNLLLKAMAEAQRSIAQAPKVGNQLNLKKPIFTKKYQETKEEKKKISENSKKILKEILDKETDTEYIPKPLKKIESINYTPSSKMIEDPTIIVTFDGIGRFRDMENNEEIEPKPKLSIKDRLEFRKMPSSIVYEKENSISEALVKTVAKNKERCKYWPNCQKGDKCEYVHPSSNCEMFPQCKFKDKCIFVHPSCKFGSSCTRRDCIYSHKGNLNLQTCKYFPNCSNVSCTFYHPKLCKFGKFCKAKADCGFFHPVLNSALTWKSK